MTKPIYPYFPRQESIWYEPKFMGTILTLVFHALKSVGELTSYWTRHPFTNVQSFDFELMTFQDSSHHFVLSVLAFSSIIEYFHLLYFSWFWVGHLSTVLYFQIDLALPVLLFVVHCKYTIISWKSINTSMLDNPTEL